jgi:DNA-binding NarL/FixJ family response regulator
MKIGQLTALIAEGYTNKAIAEELGTTEQTVKNYVRRLADKLGFDIDSCERSGKNLRVLIARWHWQHEREKQ